MNWVTYCTALSSSLNRTVIPPPSIKPLESFAITTPLHSLFIVYQLLENFTL